MRQLFFTDVKPSKQVLLLLVAFVFFFIISVLFMGVAAFMGVDIQKVENLLWIQGVSQLIMFLLPSLMFGYFFHQNTGEFLRLRLGKRDWYLPLAAMLLMVALVPFTDWLQHINDSLHLGPGLSDLEQTLRNSGDEGREVVERFLSLRGWRPFVGCLIVMALIPAVCEEFFFRGVLQQTFQKWLVNPHMAIFATSVIFSLAHGDVFAFLPRWMLGEALGYMFLFSGSIWVNVSAHFLNNALIVVLEMLFDQSGSATAFSLDDLSFPWWMVLVSTMVSSALFYWIFVKRKELQKME